MPFLNGDENHDFSLMTSGHNVGDELPMVGFYVPVQLDECLVAVGAHLLQRLPLVDPLNVNPQIEGCTSFILTLVTLKVFNFFMNNPKMSQKCSFFFEHLVTVLTRKLWLINSSLMFGYITLVCLKMPLKVLR